MSRSLKTVCLAAAVLCLGTAALAQDRPAPAATTAPRQGGDHANWRQEHEARRAQFLRDVLNIRQDQEPALQAFLADLRQARREQPDIAEPPAEAGPLTTPERLDRMAAWMAKRSAERQAAFHQRAEAVKRFYAALSPEQKRAFDALHARGEMMRRGPHGMGRLGGGPHGGDDETS
jgi:periplasmic protein CpxP/Spy